MFEFLYFSTLLFSVLAFVPGGLAACFGRDLYSQFKSLIQNFFVSACSSRSGVYQFVSLVFGSRRREVYGGCNLRRNSHFLQAWLSNNTFSPISREIPVVPSLASRMFMLTP